MQKQSKLFGHIETLWYVAYVCFRFQYLSICKRLKKADRRHFIKMLIAFKSCFSFANVSEKVKVTILKDRVLDLSIDDETFFDFFFELPLFSTIDISKEGTNKILLIKSIFLLWSTYVIYEKLKLTYSLVDGIILFLLHKVKSLSLFLNQFFTLHGSFLEGISKFLETQ